MRAAAIAHAQASSHCKLETRRLQHGHAPKKIRDHLAVGSKLEMPAQPVTVSLFISPSICNRRKSHDFLWTPLAAHGIVQWRFGSGKSGRDRRARGTYSGWARMQQARARSVGRGGAIFRGTLQRLRIREKLRLGQNWRSRSTVDTVDANASAHAGGLTFASPGIADLSTIPELSRVTSTQAAAEHEFRPAEIEDVTQLTELKHARLELARQSLQLAELLAEAEKARNLAREQAQSSAQLLAAISHDLRTPLNAVIGFSDVMQRELFGPLGHDRYRDYAGHIRESGQQLLRAAENIIAMTRPRSD